MWLNPWKSLRKEVIGQLEREHVYIGKTSGPKQRTEINFMTETIHKNATNEKDTKKTWDKNK